MTEAYNQFLQGLRRLRDNDHDQALTHLHRAVELEGHNPFFLSYLGVLQARTPHRWSEAHRHCETALQMRRNEPQFYLNLAEVYLAAGRRDDAADTLIRGLKNLPKNARIQVALNKLGGRRSPVIPFLERRHFLNRGLGRMRSLALQYFRRI